MKIFSLHAILSCFLLLAFSILQASAQQAALNRPVTVTVQDGTFSEAAGQIERQTGLMFLYKSDDIDRNRKIILQSTFKTQYISVETVISTETCPYLYLVGIFRCTSLKRHRIVFPLGISKTRVSIYRTKHPVSNTTNSFSYRF